ncbi:MAG: hypothetical protein QNI84_05685 [Henriciella sp.]|nr:hypothetical protein [Henriciella sp.]
MQNDEPYTDLTALFEAQDAAFADDGFTDRVMTPIRRRASWRSPLLFGAGGIGVGAALSQIGGLWRAVVDWLPESTVQVGGVPDVSLELGALSPLWFAAAGIMAVCCLAILVSERA